MLHLELKSFKGKKGNAVANESISCLKSGRPVGSKNKNSRKHKLQQMDNDTPEDSSSIKQTIHVMLKSSPNIDPIEEEPPKEASLKEIKAYENNKIFINYIHTREILDQNKIVINDVFAFKVAFDITKNNDEIDPQTVEECWHKNDWLIWKETIQTELNSFAKHEVFELVVHAPKGVMLVGYRWVFVRKQNENNGIVRYKEHLVARGFSQRPVIDYEETYFLVMDAITFRLLIGLVISETLDIHLMDVVTTYLHRSLYKDIHVKIPEWFKMLKAFYDKPKSVYFIKL